VGESAEELKLWLPTIPIFGGLESGTLDRIISMLKVHACQPDEEVCKQGDTGREMFVVREGEVVVCRDTDTGKRLKVVRMGPGDFFGEMTLIDIQKRSATVVVAKPSLLFSLSNRDLYTLYQQDVPGYVMVLQNLCRELSRRLRATNSRLQSMAEEVNDGISNGRTLIRPAIKR
jgi:CRP/FNR family cyclic AMP-dependent transcriptional regulator